MGGGRDEAFEKWLSRISYNIDRLNSSWSRVGEWAFPSKDSSLQEIFFHLCEGSWKRANVDGDNSASAMNGEACHTCGVKVPDGIKMISLLGKL